MKKITVAIDGYSSCGKSTFAKILADYAGYLYVDTGAMYRAIALYVLTHCPSQDSAERTEWIKHNLTDEIPLTGLGDAIRTLEVGNLASQVAVIPEVRHFLVRKQQQMGLEGGVVMDGRDIGTVVFPKAELKIFLTARPEVRAMRRFKELEGKGTPQPFEDVLRDVNDRDYRDTHREESPLRQAEDAIVLDNSDMEIPEQVTYLTKLLDAAVAKKNA